MVRSTLFLVKFECFLGVFFVGVQLLAGASGWRPGRRSASDPGRGRESLMSSRWGQPWYPKASAKQRYIWLCLEIQQEIWTPWNLIECLFSRWTPFSIPIVWGSRFVFSISDGCNGAKSIEIIIHDLISVWSARIAQNDEINTDWINEYLNFMWWINQWQNVKLATWHINTHMPTKLTPKKGFGGCLFSLGNSHMEMSLWQLWSKLSQDLNSDAHLQPPLGQEAKVDLDGVHGVFSEALSEDRIR